VTPIWAVSILQPLVGSADLGDQVSSKLLASRLDNPDWPRDGEQPRGGAGGEISWGAAGHEVTQHRVQLIDQPGPLG
jgi:hypothetical protein